MIRLGIIGAGRLGTFHADKAKAHPDVALVAVMDASASARNKLAEKHQLKSCETVSQMLPLVDAVVIATPTIWHYEMGIQCLRQGCHVLMEKPMTASWADAEHLVEAAKRSNAVFQVGHVEEFNPAWQSAKPFIDELKDEPLFFQCSRTSGYTFRSTDIGTVFDMMIHDLDLVLSMVPSRIYSVSAMGFNTLGGPHEDTASATIRFENGTIAQFFASRVAPQVERTMKIVSPHRTIQIDFGTRTTTVVSASDQVRSGDFRPEMMTPECAASLAPRFMMEQFATETLENDAVDALAKELDNFVSAIQTMTPSAVSGRRALAAIAVAEMIVESVHAQTTLYFGQATQQNRNLKIA